MQGQSCLGCRLKRFVNLNLQAVTPSLQPEEQPKDIHLAPLHCLSKFPMYCKRPLGYCNFTSLSIPILNTELFVPHKLLVLIHIQHSTASATRACYMGFLELQTLTPVTSVDDRAYFIRRAFNDCPGASRSLKRKE